MNIRFYLLVFFIVGAAPLRSEAPLPDVRFEQRIGAHLPLDTVFVDTADERHMLRDYFVSGRPVVLYFGYARCPQLCSLVADGTVAALRQIRPLAGRDFEVVAVSIDPTETREETRARKDDAVHRYGEARSAGGWHFIRGGEAEIRAVADAAGFNFVHDPRSRQYAHPSGFVVLTPDGVVSRYFLGVEFAGADVAQALKRAGRGETGLPVFDLLLRCFHGDGIGGRYGPLIWKLLGAGVGLTVCGLAGSVAWMLRQERRRKEAP